MAMANLQFLVARAQYSASPAECSRVRCTAGISDSLAFAPGISADCEQVSVLRFGGSHSQLFPRRLELSRNGHGKAVISRHCQATRRDFHGTIRADSDGAAGVGAGRRDEVRYRRSDSGSNSTGSASRQAEFASQYSAGDRRNGSPPSSFNSERTWRSESNSQSYGSGGKYRRNSGESSQSNGPGGQYRRNSGEYSQSNGPGGQYRRISGESSQSNGPGGQYRRNSERSSQSNGSVGQYRRTSGEGSQSNGSGGQYRRNSGESSQSNGSGGQYRRNSGESSQTNGSGGQYRRASGDARDGGDRRFGQGGGGRGYDQNGRDRGYGQGRGDSRPQQSGNGQGYGARGSSVNQRGYAGRDDRASNESSRNSRGPGQGQGRAKTTTTTRKNNNPTPNPVAQTVTPRDGSRFVSNRQVHRAPWEQGPTSSGDGRSSSVWKREPEGNSQRKNPLIERLQKELEEAELEEEELEEAEADESDDDQLDVGDEGEIDNAYGRDSDSAGGKSAMARIAEKLGSISAPQSPYEPTNRNDGRMLEGQASTSWRPRSNDTRERDWARMTAPRGAGVKKSGQDNRFPWERADEAAEAEGRPKEIRVKPPSLAELTLPDEDLRRLRSLGILTRHRIKVGRLGVTNGIVESMHNEWRNSEVVRVKCEGPPAQNMKHTHETLEQRTGGLVIWRAGGAVLVYRGKDYVPRPLKEYIELAEIRESEAAAAGDEGEDNFDGSAPMPTTSTVVVPRVNSIYDPELEKEMEEILTSLGTRYDDWTGMRPVPVDADLLAGPYAKYKKPIRMLPYGVRRNLTNTEMTNLRKLARPIPPHFVLGWNRGLEGLAAAIIKLWEKSEIVKIAVKRGIQNTSHERMGEELKRLTGGLLLARDKFYIVLYRGKDFLPAAVSEALEERQKLTSTLLEAEESFRCLPQKQQGPSDASVALKFAGTLAETLELEAKWSQMRDSDSERRSREEAEELQRRDVARRIQRKIATANAKRAKATWDLQKVEKSLRPAGPPEDREHITDEERHMFSKLGLKMSAFLLLGRRGIFGGTVENMHLHWKHRELVKIIYKATDKIDLEQTARMLEYESGGILVATIPTNKGQAIIVYRGKNYQRPPQLRPKSLLTKRQALKRSIEMQRYQALTKHLMDLERQTVLLQSDLSKIGDDQNLETVRETESDSDEDDMDEQPGRRPEKGMSDVVSGLATAIDIHFQTHALVKVGLKDEGRGFSAATILGQLEEITGAEVVSRGAASAILYRGWADGQERPTADGFQFWEDLPPEVRDAMMSAVEDDEDYLHQSDWEDFEDEGDEDEDESDYDSTEEASMYTIPETEGYLSSWDECESDEEGSAAEVDGELDSGEFDGKEGSTAEVDGELDSGEFDDEDEDENGTQDDDHFDLNEYEAKLSRSRPGLAVGIDDGIKTNEKQEEGVLTKFVINEVS